MRALLQGSGFPPALLQAPGSSISDGPAVSLLPAPAADNMTTPIVVTTTLSSGGGSSFALGPVAYISGICLLVAVAICLLLVACVLRRKDRRQAAALAAQQEAQLAAATAAAQQEAAYRAAHPPTIPVVIVNPDGQFELAEEIKGHSPAAKAGGSDVPEEWGTSGGSKGGEAPIGFHTSRA